MTFYNVHNSQHSCVVQVLFMCGFDKHLLAARLVPLPRHGNFTKKITYTSDFFIIIRYLLSTQSMISRLYLGKYKARPVAQMDDTRKTGTFTQWNCDCGKTTTTT